MSDPMLRLYDGYAHTSPHLRDTVRELQAMLRRHDRAVVIDGLFGRGTEDLVRSFQRSAAACAATAWSVPILARSARPRHADAGGALRDDLSARPSDAPRGPGSRGTLRRDHHRRRRRLRPAAGADRRAGLARSRWGLALSPKGPTGTADLTPRPFLGLHRTAPLPPDGRGFARG